MNQETPLAIDLYCGLGGWAEGLLAEGWRVVGFDIEQHDYGTGGYPGQLVIQDVLTLHGSQFKDASLIVASPPCQEYSYMAMPWSRSKQISKALRGHGDFPAGYVGSRTIEELNALFDACFRIQREANEAVECKCSHERGLHYVNKKSDLLGCAFCPCAEFDGPYIPLIVENVRGAQKWVGHSVWNFGSYHLWGDVPALMPIALPRCGRKLPEGHDTFARTGKPCNKFTDAPYGSEGIKQAGISGIRNNGKGARWFQDGAARHGSKSNSRKAASAMIAKIPFPLAKHIAQTFKELGT